MKTRLTLAEKHNKWMAWLAMMTTLVMISACGTTNKVTRVDVEQEIALSDRWNEKDSQLVAEEMINDMLSFPWISSYQQRYGDQRKPTVIIQSVRNKSHEHIEAETFTNDLKRSMIRSGKIDFVVGGQERAQVRHERHDQQTNAQKDTVAQQGQEIGANFALSGSINSFVNENKKDRVTTYQVDLKLIDLERNLEVWNGQKKIKKLQETKRTLF